ncbi:hypothetical protein Pla110_46410 [Polystyrenella longa]|uniref:Uncharacterized protein n=1 Tax=Polystyrenella longa TaxID=2528007 RepID=A0A518CUI9_9PLAN|nr:hypothetical protein [Polystyrenella longa]QDU82878.1 hypothetical protein Pla110_46410 [Polystyrenella longa]
MTVSILGILVLLLIFVGLLGVLFIAGGFGRRNRTLDLSGGLLVLLGMVVLFAAKLGPPAFQLLNLPTSGAPQVATVSEPSVGTSIESPSVSINAELQSEVIHSHPLIVQRDWDWVSPELLTLVLLFSGFSVWFLIRSTRFRAAALSLVAGVTLLAVLWMGARGVSQTQTWVMDSTSTISSDEAGQIIASQPTEVQMYFQSWSKVLFIVAVAISLVFAFAMYVFFVSRRPTTEVRSSRFLHSTLWALPVVLISGMVLLTYLDHLQRTIQVPEAELVRIDGEGTDIDLPHGGFESGMILEIQDDLSLDQLEIESAELPTDTATISGSSPQDPSLEVTPEDGTAKEPAKAESPPSETAIALEYPEWIERGAEVRHSEVPEGDVFRFTVMSDLFESNAAAVEDALHRLSQQTIHLYGTQSSGSALQRIPNEFLRSSAVIHTYSVAGLVTTEQNKFPMYRVWLDCEVDTFAGSQPFQYWKEVLVQHRMWTLAGLIGFFVLVFVALSILFRLNHFSQGQFERRLKLAYIILVLVAGIGVMSLIA